MRGKGRRAGGRGDALGNLEAHRRRSRCRPALRPLHTARSISTTAAHCLPRASTYSCSCTSPTRRRRRAAAASCACTSARCASSRNRRPAPTPVRARLRARGWVPGWRASGKSRVETPSEQGENRNLPCALEAWTPEDRCISRDDASCARTAEAGVIPGRHCGESRLPSSRAPFSGGLRSMWCARRRHGWARCITERASKPGRSCATSNIECAINRAAGGCANVFWQRRSGALRRAPRAIPEPGCGLKRTVRWLMSVVRCPTFKRRCPKSLSTVNRDGERAFVPPSRLVAPGGGVNFPDRSD